MVVSSRRAALAWSSSLCNANLDKCEMIRNRIESTSNTILDKYMQHDNIRYKTTKHTFDLRKKEGGELHFEDGANQSLVKGSITWHP